MQGPTANRSRIHLTGGAQTRAKRSRSRSRRSRVAKSILWHKGEADPQCDIVINSIVEAALHNVILPKSGMREDLRVVLFDVLTHWKKNPAAFVKRHRKIGRGGLGTVFAFLNNTKRGKKKRETELVGKRIRKVPKEMVRIIGKVKVSQEREMVIQTMCATVGISIFPIALIHINKEHTDSLMIMQRLPPGQTVTKFVKSNWRDEKQMAWLRGKIMDTVMRMHGIGVMHGDLHGDNMWVTASGEVLVLDFGRSVQLNTRVMNSMGKMTELMIMSDEYVPDGFEPEYIFERWANQAVWDALSVPAAKNRKWMDAMVAMQSDQVAKFNKMDKRVTEPIRQFLKHHAKMLVHLSPVQRNMLVNIQALGVDIVLVTLSCFRSAVKKMRR